MYFSSCQAARVVGMRGARHATGGRMGEKPLTDNHGMIYQSTEPLPLWKGRPSEYWHGVLDGMHDTAIQKEAMNWLQRYNLREGVA